jgi:hypothetical protein
MHISSVAGISAPTLVSAGIAAPPQHCVAIFLSQRQQNPKRFQAEWQMKCKTAIRPSNGAADRNLRLVHRSPPSDWRSAAAIHTAGWRKIRAAPGRSPHPSHFGTVEFTAKPQLGDIKPKVLPRVPHPFSAFGPYFSPNLRPILGVPVRRLWK